VKGVGKCGAGAGDSGGGVWRREVLCEGVCAWRGAGKMGRIQALG
jgi:hypothetical protein